MISKYFLFYCFIKIYNIFIFLIKYIFELIIYLDYNILYIFHPIIFLIYDLLYNILYKKLYKKKYLFFIINCFNILYNKNSLLNLVF